jgi:hypothetical protein
MNVRLQTWFPYHIQIALNGREWLRRRLEARGVEFLRHGNKFLHIEDYMPDMFRVYRRAQGQPHTARKKLRPLRKGVADIPLRAQVSQEVNNRLMDQLSTFSHTTPVIDLLAPCLIRKLPNRHRYHLTDKGRQLTTALNAMLSASTEQLLDMAA